MQTIFEKHPIFNKYSISEIIDLMFDKYIEKIQKNKNNRLFFNEDYQTQLDRLNKIENELYYSTNQNEMHYLQKRREDQIKLILKKHDEYKFINITKTKHKLVQLLKNNFECTIEYDDKKETIYIWTLLNKCIQSVTFEDDSIYLNLNFDNIKIKIEFVYFGSLKIFDNFEKLSKCDTYNTDYVIYFDQQQSLWYCEYLKYISLDQLLYKLFKTYCTFSLVE